MQRKFFEFCDVNCRPVARIPETVLSERTTRQVILTLQNSLTWFVSSLYDIACGKDIKTFILVSYYTQKKHVLAYL